MRDELREGLETRITAGDGLRLRLRIERTLTVRVLHERGQLMADHRREARDLRAVELGDSGGLGVLCSCHGCHGEWLLVGVNPLTDEKHTHKEKTVDDPEHYYRENDAYTMGKVVSKSLVMPTIDYFQTAKDADTLDPDGQLKTAAEVWDYIAEEARSGEVSSRKWVIQRRLFARVLDTDHPEAELFISKLKPADEAWAQEEKGEATKSGLEPLTLSPSAATFQWWCKRTDKITQSTDGSFLK